MRSEDAARDPRAIGLPAWHPPIGALLGVPIALRDAHWGEIYVANRRAGGSFGEDEEATLRSLATFLSYALEQHEAHAVSAAEDTLRQTADLLAGCAHEILNPLAAARLNLQALRDTAARGSPSASGEIGGIADEALESLERISALIKKTQAAVTTPVRPPGGRVNVAAVLRDAAARIEAEFPAAAPITLEPSEELWLAGPAADRVTFVLDAVLRWCARRADAGAGAGGDVFARAARTPGGAVAVEIGHRAMAAPEDGEAIFAAAYRPTAAAGGRVEFELDLWLARAAAQAAGVRLEAGVGPGGPCLAFRMEFAAVGPDG